MASCRCWVQVVVPGCGRGAVWEWGSTKVERLSCSAVDTSSGRVAAVLLPPGWKCVVSLEAVDATALVTGRMAGRGSTGHVAGCGAM